MDYEADNLYAASAENFANFNFTQAVVKILDNMGFSSTNAHALELLTSMMRRYFEDLCRRISLQKDNGGRQLPSLGDVHVAFKAQNVSLTELNDYVRQVQTLPEPPQIPEFPVKRFNSTEPEIFRPHVFNADPFADEVPTLEEVEEKYGKAKPEDQEEAQASGITDGESEKMDLDGVENKVTIDEDPLTLFKSWNVPEGTELPNFSGFSAKDLGFNIDFYKRQFVEADIKKNKASQDKKSKNASSLPKLFEPFSTTSFTPASKKVKSLDMLVEKIKKHKKHKEKDREKSKDRKKDKHKEKKHREPAPTLTPAIPLPVPSSEPDSGVGDSLKLNIGLIEPAASEKNEPSNGTPTKTDNVKEEPIKIHEPIKSNITPPPTLEQIIPKLPVVDEALSAIQKPLTDANFIKTDKTDESKKERRHKKEKKKKREKDESRKRKHEEISNSLPPTLELSVNQEAEVPSPVQPVTEPNKEPSLIPDPPSVVIQQPVDKPITPPGPSAVRLKIRIGSTLSSDSMKSSPVETHASKPSSAGITPPTLVTEQKDEAIVENPVVAVNSDEPPPKKHKKEKKHKRDKNREMHFETEEQKAEYERQRKERKEKKLREKEANGHSNNNNKASTSDQQPIRLNEQPKKDETAPHAPLKFKFKNGLENRSSEDKNQKVNEIFSLIKEKQKENSDRPEKTESKDKSHKKKHKKDKKHKDKEPRPTSSHSITDLTEKPKPKSTIKLLNQQSRPSSQNSALPKLFDPTPFKPDIKKGKTSSLPKPSKPEKAANISTGSSTSSKSEKKEVAKKKHPKSDSKSNKESDVVWVCPVCSVAYVDDSADMIGCDNCQNWFHFACVGMLQPPPENQDWFCMKCVEEKRKKAKNRKK